MIGNGNEAPPESDENVDVPNLYDLMAQTTRPKIAWWHNEMSRYIKEDLNIRDTCYVQIIREPHQFIATLIHQTTPVNPNIMIIVGNPNILM